MQAIRDWFRRHWVACTVVALLVIQVAQFTYVIHRESLTFDEDNHSFSGYMMWHTHDYGLNPEHPPLVKLLAAIPTLDRHLWTPPLQHRFFKNEADLDGRDWLVGEQRTAADLFLFMLTRWGRRLEPAAWERPRIRAHFSRTLELPGVRRLIEEQALELPDWAAFEPSR